MTEKVDPNNLHPKGTLNYWRYWYRNTRMTDDDIFSPESEFSTAEQLAILYVMFDRFVLERMGYDD